MTERFRGVVLSGGGARGAYAAGVLLALREVDKIERERPDATPEQKAPITYFYVGTSVGALNAALAAQGKLDDLARIYLREATKQRLLGDDSADVTKWGMVKRGGRVPFAYFDSSGLASLIQNHVDFDALANAHLLVCATAFKSGKRVTFYRSKLVDEFRAEDSEVSEDRRRLQDYEPLETMEQLHSALLASAAIPFFYPPVTVRGTSYVDGGVGNNTPTRQAARFARFLEKLDKGKSEFTVCVIQDPVSFIMLPDVKADLSNVVQRTLDIFGHTLTEATLEGWQRINREVAKAQERAAQLQALIDSDPNVPEKTKERFRAEIVGMFDLTTALAPRVEQDLLVIRPSNTLPSSGPLDFDVAKSRTLMKIGYEDFLNVARARNMIIQEERNLLSNKTDLPFNQ